MHPVDFGICVQIATGRPNGYFDAQNCGSSGDAGSIVPAVALWPGQGGAMEATSISTFSARSIWIEAAIPIIRRFAQYDDGVHQKRRTLCIARDRL